MSGWPGFPWMRRGGGAVATGTPSTRPRLVFVGLGESGMTGYGSLSDAVPAYYPPVDGGVQVYDDSGVWMAPLRALEDPGPSPAYPVLVDGFTPGHGWVGFALAQWSAHVGSGYQLCYVDCGRDGSTSLQWAVNTATTERYGAALARTLAVLAEPATTFGGFFLDQGINDAIAGIQAGWSTRWVDIITSFAAALGVTDYVVQFRKFQLTCPGPIAPADWTQLRAENDLFASAVSPKRVLNDSPDGVNFDAYHLTTAGNITLGDTVYASMLATPPVYRAALGNPTKTSPASTDALAWWDARSAVDGSQWVDTITGYVAPQAIALARPTLVADAGNGNPAFQFDGAAKYFDFPAALAGLFNGAHAFTAYMAYRRTADTGTYQCLWDMSTATAPDDRFSAVLDPGNTIFWPLRTNDGGAAEQAGTWPKSERISTRYVWAMSWGGTPGSFRQWYNGGRAKQQTDTWAASLAGLNDGAIGALKYTGTVAFYFSGYLSQLVICPTQHSDATARAVSAYLADLMP